MQKPLLIMGIDPGLANTGWGVIEVRGSRKRCVAYGCCSTSADDPIDKRLKQIHDGIVYVIKRYHPTELGIESIFFSANAKSAIATGQARGAALVAVACEGLVVGEYTPLQIKQTIVGNGRADKNQVTYMVRTILGLDHDPKPDHAADALGAAICHAHLRNSVEKRYAEELANSDSSMGGEGDSREDSKGRVKQDGDISMSPAEKLAAAKLEAEREARRGKAKSGGLTKADLAKLGISSGSAVGTGTRLSGWE